MSDVDWLAAPSRRSRFRVGALVALAVLLVFLGGVEVQKRWGAAGSESSTGGPTLGSFPAGGALPGGNTGTPSDSTAGGSTPAGSAQGAPAVIGTLTRVHGHLWTVKDLGGRSHTVKVSAATTVTRSLAQAGSRIRRGAGVTVQGKRHGDTVVATAVTIR